MRLATRGRLGRDAAARGVRDPWRMADAQEQRGVSASASCCARIPGSLPRFFNGDGRSREDYRIFTVSTGTPPATGNLLLARLLDAEPLA